MKHPYEDILRLPHHRSGKRAPMSLQDRAAQFSPFAALTGYDGVIAENGRQTTGQNELDEDEIARLDGMLRYIRDHLPQLPRVRLTVFRPDARKAGGAYEEITGHRVLRQIRKHFLCPLTAIPAYRRTLYCGSKSR